MRYTESKAGEPPLSESLYEIVALGARYVFAGLMVLIVLRAWRITLVDSRRANVLRRLSPQTGLSGELLVLEGDEKARRGMRYPVTREGMIGTSRRSDIRIRHSSIRRRHAWFQLRSEGLVLRARPAALMADAHGQRASRLLLADGDTFFLGKVRLMLVLSQSQPSPSPFRQPGAEPDPIADPLPPEPDDLFMEQPVLRRPERPHQSARMHR